jgi:hypothetical protein
VVISRGIVYRPSSELYKDVATAERRAEISRMRSQRSIKGRGDCLLSVARKGKGPLKEAHGESDAGLLSLRFHRCCQELGRRNWHWNAANGPPRYLACAAPRPTGYCRECAVMATACASFTLDSPGSFTSHVKSLWRLHRLRHCR